MIFTERMDMIMIWIWTDQIKVFIYFSSFDFVFCFFFHCQKPSAGVNISEIYYFKNSQKSLKNKKILHKDSNRI